ncbi:MAG: hypothetical protein Q9219_005289 [cf. Caloplaca sp. 3 TL-2023]
MQTQSQPLWQSGQENGTPQKNKRGTRTGKVGFSIPRPPVARCNEESDDERTPTKPKKKSAKLEHPIASPPVVPDRKLRRTNRFSLPISQHGSEERRGQHSQNSGVSSGPGPVAALRSEEVQKSRSMSEPADAREYEQIRKSKGNAPASAPPDWVSTPKSRFLPSQLPEALVKSNQSSSSPAQSASDQEVSPPSGPTAEDDCSAEMLDFPDQLSAQSLDDLIGNRMLDDSVVMALLGHGMRSQCVLIDCLALVAATPPPPSEARKSAARQAARIILPFHQAAAQHWVLFVYYPRIHRLECFNSLESTTSSDCPGSVRTMLSSLFGRQMDSGIECHSIPSQQQSNGVDCGIYVIHHSHAICRGEFIVPTMAIDTHQLRRQYFHLLSSSSSCSSVTRTTGATSTAHVEFQPPTPFAPGLQFAPSLLRPGSSAATHQSKSRDEAAEAYMHLLHKYNEAHAQYCSLFSLHHGLLEAQEQLILAPVALQRAEHFLQHTQAMYTAWPGTGTSGVGVARQGLADSVLPVVRTWLAVAMEDMGRAQAEYQDWLEKRKKSEAELGDSRDAKREALKKREDIRAEIEEWLRYTNTRRGSI